VETASALLGIDYYWLAVLKLRRLWCRKQRG